MALLLLPVFSLSLHGLFASKTGCTLGEKYICEDYTTSMKGTTVITENKTLCRGKCYSSKFCNGTWSDWTSRSSRLDGTFPAVERRQRFCHDNQRAEMELRHVQNHEENLRNQIKRRVKRRTIGKTRDDGLPHKLNKKIYRRLKNLNEKFVVSVGRTVRLSCATVEEEEIKRKYPRSKHKWILNDVQLKLDGSRMKSRGLQLEISNVDPHDQGLYTCRINYKPKRRKTIYFATLVMKNIGIPVEIKETETLKLRCPTSPIGRLFDNSFRDWSLNGKQFVSGIPAKSRSFEYFRNVSKKHEGIWTCRVVDEMTTRRWEVIKYEVTVTTLPPPKNKYEEWFRNNPVFIGTQSLGVIGFVLAVFIGCCYSPKNKNKDDEKKKLMENDSIDDLSFSTSSDEQNPANNIQNSFQDKHV